MSLTRKTLLIIVITVTILTAVAEWFLFSVLEEQFIRLETTEAITNTHRAKRALLDEVAQLEVKEQDWSRWDDTYEFMQTRSSEYIASNLSKESAANLDLLNLIFIKPDETVFFDLQRDQVKESNVGLDFMNRIRGTDLLKQALQGQNQKGILKLGQDLVLFSAQNILTSQGEGPPRGVLVFIRLLDHGMRSKLAVQTELMLAIDDVEKVGESFREALTVLEDLDTPYLQRADDSTLYGFDTIEDPWGKPVALIRLNLPRTIYNQGAATRALLLLTLCVSSFVMTSVMLALLNWQVIRRLKRLSSEVGQITESQDTTNRLNDSGQDEIAAVAKGLNEMLCRLNSYELNLRNARDAAESACAARAQFIANVSHEVRTPMNGILGMTEVILRLNKNPETAQYVTMIRDCAQALLGVINDILDFSKIDAGKLEIEETEFSLETVVRESLQAVSFRAQEKGLQVECNFDLDLPLYITGDPLRLRQVLVNLLGNAVKFTTTGKITLAVQLLHHQDQAKGMAEILFAVTDTGVGIPQDRQAKVFESFTQADGSTSRKFGGTGLGLTISREIVTAMGGELKLESAVGKGSCFSFVVSFPSPNSESFRAALALTSYSSTISCILSNSSDFISWCSLTLEGLGVASPILNDAPSEFFSGNNLLVLDLDSLDPTSIPVLISQCSSCLRVIAFVCSAKGELASTIRNRENISVVLKPALPSDLAAAINGHSNSLSSGTPQDLDSPTPAQPLNILVVDDVPMNLEVLRLLLAPLGHNLTFAQNGIEAVNAFNSSLSQNNNPTKLFDVIIMDEQMPEMDGVEATRNIRMIEKEQNIAQSVPIIGCSANAQQADKNRLLTAGMSDTLSKPITGRGIMEKLALWCQPNLHHSIGQVASESSHTLALNRVFDTADLLERYNNNQSIIDEMLALYKEELPEFLNEITTAIDNRDPDKLRRAAHSLKGVLQNLSGTRAADAASSLEKLAGQADLNGCLEAKEKLNYELKLLDDEIRNYRY